jgi:small conductance mechanosensitive channel
MRFENISSENMSSDSMSSGSMSPESMSPESMSPESMSPESMCPESMCPDGMRTENMCPRIMRSKYVRGKASIFAGNLASARGPFAVTHVAAIRSRIVPTLTMPTLIGLMVIALVFAAIGPRPVFAQDAGKQPPAPAIATSPVAATAAAPPPTTSLSPRELAERRCAANHFGDCLDAVYETGREAILNLLRKIPLLVLATLVLLLAHWVSRFIANRLHLLKIRSQNPYMSGLVRMVVRTAIMLIGILIALDLLGMSTVVGAVLGSAGVAGLVLGFAFREIAENYIAGILLSVRRPFEPGDHVVIENREGKVISVNSRSTLLMTFDGAQVQLPNSLVFKSVVINYSRNSRRRFDFSMLIDGSQSIRRSQTLAMEAIAQIDGVLDDPAPAWSVVEFGANGIQLRFFGWVNQHDTDMGKVRSEAIRRVKAAFADAGIEAPRAVYHVVATRSRDGTSVESVVEPTNHETLDTSVNRDIDTQIAEAKQNTGGRNLLDPQSPSP